MWGTLETLGLIRTLTALVGAAMLLVGVRAYRATRRTSILCFSLGMGTASAGYLLEGVLVELAGWSLPSATLLESVVSLVAFSVLAAGIWVRDSPSPRGVKREARPTIR